MELLEPPRMTTNKDYPILTCFSRILGLSKSIFTTLAIR